MNKKNLDVNKMREGFTKMPSLEEIQENYHKSPSVEEMQKGYKKINYKKIGESN